MKTDDATAILAGYGYANKLPGGGEPELRKAIRTLLAATADAHEMPEAAAAFVDLGDNWIGVDPRILVRKINLMEIVREWAFLKRAHGGGPMEDCGVTRDVLEDKYGPLGPKTTA